jgi:hypothetical protein
MAHCLGSSKSLGEPLWASSRPTFHKSSGTSQNLLQPSISDLTDLIEVRAYNNIESLSFAQHAAVILKLRAPLIGESQLQFCLTTAVPRAPAKNEDIDYSELPKMPQTENLDNTRLSSTQSVWNTMKRPRHTSNPPNFRHGSPTILMLNARRSSESLKPHKHSERSALDRWTRSLARERS